MDIIGTVEYFPTPQKKKLENNVTTKSEGEKKQEEEPSDRHKTCLKMHKLSREGGIKKKEENNEKAAAKPNANQH